ncbi:MAG: NAD(P)/FAD-dependent oxidoreductase, partial [Clostridiales bacterium]|nr:NAD(P)/FAD-dependent oxidoreductase [Clostridiales bacterium]
MLYDLIVLGGGPAGYLAAERAGHADFKVALIEERNLGGVCLNEGCIPTKTMLYSAKLFDGVKYGEKYGVKATDLIIDHATVIKRKNKVVKILVAGVKAQMKASRVTTYSGRGKILDKLEDSFVVGVGEDTIKGKRVLIATGSSPAMAPIKGLTQGIENRFVLTNREVLDLDTKPSSLCVIGGGIIGLEIASYFNSIGSQVTVIEMLDHIAGENDQELVSILKADMEKKGIRFELNAKVTAFEKNAVLFEQQTSRRVEAEKVLLSIGRRPNTENIGLEALEIILRNGSIVTDNQMLTNVPHVYAAGDVNGKSMLAHTAYREAEVAVNTMLGIKDSMNYQAIPSVIYTNPELSSVGESELTASQKNLNYKTVKLPMNYSGRY